MDYFLSGTELENGECGVLTITILEPELTENSISGPLDISQIEFKMKIYDDRSNKLGTAEISFVP